jgi:hypothetical protein
VGVVVAISVGCIVAVAVAAAVGCTATGVV